MSILTVLQDVAAKVGMEVPTAVMASTAREHAELKALANEVAARIAKAHEWRALAVLATYTGDGVAEDFSLPADFDRMPVEAKIWSSSLQNPLTRVESLDDWLGMIVQNVDVVFGAWIIYGGQMHIRKALGSGATARHWYQSNLIVQPNAGANKAAFAADDDTFRLSERLLKLGLIWEWKSSKGRPYAEDMATYEELKEKLIVADMGARILGRRGRVRGVDMALPVSVTP